MNDLINLTLLVFLGSILGLVGGVVFMYNKKLSRILEQNSVPFAAGVLLTVSFLGLIPEAVEHAGEQAYLIILISFFTVFIFEKVIFEIHHHDDGHQHSDIKSSVIFVIIGDTVHNLIDGLTIGASFLVSPTFGLATAFSTFLHEVPHEVGDFGILLKANWKKNKVILVNLCSALATFLGAYLIYFTEVSDILIGFMLSISAGIFLYLGAIDFLPQIVEKGSNKLKNIFPLVLGALIMLTILMLFPHSNE